jgi:hypothetical protein
MLIFPKKIKFLHKTNIENLNTFIFGEHKVQFDFNHYMLDFYDLDGVWIDDVDLGTWKDTNLIEDFIVAKLWKLLENRYTIQFGSVCNKVKV